MSNNVKTLLLADPASSEDISRRLGGAGQFSCCDAYDALIEMGRRRYSTIVLTAPLPDFAGLCRASRRLQEESALFAICSPSAEPQVRQLAGGVLDDYFIYPPSRSELATIHRGERRRDVPQDDSGGGLSARDLSSLLEAAHNIRSLESYLAAEVSRRIGAAVEWVDADKLRNDVQPLLLAAGDAPRVLVPTGGARAVDSATEVFLSAVRGCLPALVANARRTESLHRLAITDHLTGAYNRRYFYHLTDQVLRRGGRKNFRVTLLLFDIDNFKRYNDTYGHAAGDEILRETASLMKRVTRSHDIVARIGGDEFAVLFWDGGRLRSPDSRPPESAFALSDRFREMVAGHEFSSLGPEAKGILTISGGLATYPDGGKTCRELLRGADQALRAVKETGKNAIRLVGRE